MILTVGLRVRLPSGNVIVLRQHERTHWICEYIDSPKARGLVEFSAAWLLRYGRPA